MRNVQIILEPLYAALLHCCCTPAQCGTSIANEQYIRLEAIQRGAINIINGVKEDSTTFCINNNLPSVYERRCELSKHFFNNSVLPSPSCLQYLFA
jgi:hypothetical protein